MLLLQSPTKVRAWRSAGDISAARQRGVRCGGRLASRSRLPRS